MSNETKMYPNFVPTVNEAQVRSKIYDHFETMQQLKHEKMPHFAGPDGQRSWLQYIDDSERILNGYTLSRGSQGKEDWQSNMMDNVTLAKIRALAAGVGLKTPEMAFQAMNKDAVRSPIRAEVFKNIVNQSFNNSNATLHSYLEIWHMLCHGSIFEFEGYKTGGAMIPKVESFDSTTGQVKTKKEYVKFDGKPFSILLNPQEFYWWTFFVRDVQDQPRIAWVQHYTKKQIEEEFSKFPNYKFLKDKKEAENLNLQNSLYFNKWNKRVQDEDDYEVIRMYSKADDGNEKDKVMGHEVWSNGVPLIRSPLLWGEQEKDYPFAKQISNLFANTNFFVGMSWPAILEAYQDTKNTTINSLVDKIYRGVDPLTLVGLQNKDLLEVESQITTSNNRIYVPDIQQVKPFPTSQVNQGELAMLAVLDRGIEVLSVDRAQQGIQSNQQKTARQAIIEDTRAKELKGSLYSFLEDLWYQKTKLRMQVILTHYLKDKAARSSKRDQVISIEDYQFGDGKQGTLDIHIAKTKKELLPLLDIEAREKAAEENGQVYKMISILSSFFDNWDLDMKIVPQSIHNQDRIAKEEEFDSEVQWVATLAPDFFVANKEKYLQEKLAFRGKHLSDFNPPEEQQPEPTEETAEGVPTEEGTPPPAQTPKSPLDEGAELL